MILHPTPNSSAQGLVGLFYCNPIQSCAPLDEWWNNAKYIWVKRTIKFSGLLIVSEGNASNNTAVRGSRVKSAHFDNGVNDIDIT